MNDEQIKPGRGLRFDWADGPDDPPEPYTSVELQHLATEWRIESQMKVLRELLQENTEDELPQNPENTQESK